MMACDEVILCYELTMKEARGKRLETREGLRIVSACTASTSSSASMKAISTRVVSSFLA